MRQITQNYKSGKITLNEVPQPSLKPSGVLVRNVASLISPGTEKMMIEMVKKACSGRRGHGRQEIKNPFKAVKR